MNGRQISRVAVAAATALALALVPAAFAAKGGKPAGGGTAPSGSSIRLVLLDGATEVRYGGRITFEVTSSAEKPYVNLRCYQGTAFVYDGWVGYYAGAWFSQYFTLSGAYWTGGAADCTARLVTFGRNGSERTLSSLSFHVDP